MVKRAELFHVKIFAFNLNSLSGEITNNVRQVSSPERFETLLCNDSPEAVANSFVHVSTFWDNVLVSILNLKQQLYSLKWSSCHL